MSRKMQICKLVEERPRTTAELAAALGAKTSTISVAVATTQNLGLIKPVGMQPKPHDKAVIIWGPA